MTTFSGEGVPVYQATALASAIRLYRRSRIMVQRGAGPKALLSAASSITKKQYKMSQLEQAELDLREWADAKVEGWTEEQRKTFIS